MPVVSHCEVGTTKPSLASLKNRLIHILAEGNQAGSGGKTDTGHPPGVPAFPFLVAKTKSTTGTVQW